MCKYLWVSVASGANSAWLFCSLSSLSPYAGAPRGNNGSLVSLGCKARRRDRLSSAAPGFGLSNGDVSRPLLPGNFRSPKEGFTVWRQLRIIITLNLATPVS